MREGLLHPTPRQNQQRVKVADKRIEQLKALA